MERVAVITAVFNGREFIGECVESVRHSATLGEFEVEHIVVDDGSTDGTGEMLADMEKKGLIRVCHLGGNYGQAYARNRGLEQADADYVFFLDADDLLFANALRQLKTFGAEWAYGDFVKGDTEGRYLAGQDYYGKQFESGGDMLASMFAGKHFFQQNSLFKRRTLEKVGGFDEKLRMAEDFDLAARLLFKGLNPLYLPGALYMHRCHDKNLSAVHQVDLERHRRDVTELFLRYERKLKEVLTASQIEAVIGYVRG